MLNNQPLNILLETLNQPLIEMANIYKADYDLPVNCWISAETQNKHLPRIKVQQDKGNKLNYGNFCSVSISNNPEVLAGKWLLRSKDTQDIFAFIEENVEELLDMWYNECSAVEATNRIKQRRNQLRKEI